MFQYQKLGKDIPLMFLKYKGQCKTQFLTQIVYYYVDMYQGFANNKGLMF